MRRIKEFAFEQQADSIDIVCNSDSAAYKYWVRHGFTERTTVLGCKQAWDAKLEEKHG
jgi:hypothetical protein